MVEKNEEIIMSVIKVNGGIITDQMLTGSLRFFAMTGPFANTVSDGTILIPGTETYVDMPTTPTPFMVALDKPVPESAADVAFRTIMEKCTVVQIALISDTEIHFAVSASAIGWGDPLASPEVTVVEEMLAAVQALGTITVPDATTTGTTADLSTVTITEVDFQLVTA